MRSQLVATAAVVGVAVAALAVTGFLAIQQEWYSPTDVALWVAIGSVLVYIAATSRVFFLFRLLRRAIAFPDYPTPPAPRPAENVGARPVQNAPRPEPTTLIPPAFADRTDQRGEVFAKLSSRLQSLVNRLIHSIDRMEHEIEDPDLLNKLWAIDHLATLVRRQTENIAVLGGEALQRRSDAPVDVNAVLRSAVAEIQRYRHVTTIPIRDARIHGHVVAEIIHLLSELLDNATTFTPDDAPKVAFRAQYVTAGLAIQVQDRGLGMDDEELRRLNRLLEGPSHVDLSQLFKDGRIGLAVVKELARRHGIGVELQPNIYGGIDASIVVPHSLLTPRSTDARTRRRPSPGPSPRAVSGGGPPPARPPHPALETARSAPAESAIAVAPSFPAQPPGWPAQPGEPVGRHSMSTTTGPDPADRRWDAVRPETAEDQQRELPVQEREPAYSPLPPAEPFDPADQGGDRPALPQRRGDQTHLREELLAAPTLARPVPGHNPNLLADIQLGRVVGSVEGAREPEGDHVSDEPQQQPPNDRTTKGEGDSWPTI